MIYTDGTRFDGKGWRDAEGRALDDNGKVIKAKGAKGGTGKSKAERDAEAAKKKAERETSNAVGLRGEPPQSRRSRRRRELRVAGLDRRTHRTGSPETPRPRHQRSRQGASRQGQSPPPRRTSPASRSRPRRRRSTRTPRPRPSVRRSRAEPGRVEGPCRRRRQGEADRRISGDRQELPGVGEGTPRQVRRVRPVRRPNSGN